MRRSPTWWGPVPRASWWPSPRSRRSSPAAAAASPGAGSQARSTLHPRAGRAPRRTAAVGRTPDQQASPPSSRPAASLGSRAGPADPRAVRTARGRAAADRGRTRGSRALGEEGGQPLCVRSPGARAERLAGDRRCAAAAAAGSHSARTASPSGRDARSPTLRRLSTPSDATHDPRAATNSRHWRTGFGDCSSLLWPARHNGPPAARWPMSGRRPRRTGQPAGSPRRGRAAPAPARRPDGDGAGPRSLAGEWDGFDRPAGATPRAKQFPESRFIESLSIRG
jgi:hypothetical protein